MKACLAAIWVVLFFSPVTLLGQAMPERGITQVSGDLYRAQNGRHFTVFLVTPDGIILSDPINREFAQWLKAELDDRFDQPVRFVVYSHHHWDHASGGEVFAETATFVGQEASIEALRLPSADTVLPENVAGMDTNANGQVEREEAMGVVRENFDLYDANGDAVLTGAEVTRGPVSDVYPPQVLFSDNGVIRLGGKEVELIYVGPAHAPDMTMLRFPEENTVFLVDIVSVRRLPYLTLDGVNVDELVDAILKIEDIDFEIAVGGHGIIGTKQHVAAYREYFEELRERVASGIAAGESLEELQANITMDGYRDWLNYEWLPLNIQGMYRILTTD